MPNVRPLNENKYHMSKDRYDELRSRCYQSVSYTHLGLKVYLCRRHHKEGKDAVHNCRATRERLCAYLQEAYEQDHTREEWMNIAYKNYL